MSSSDEAALKSWLAQNGGYYNTDAEFSATPSGYRVVAKNDLPSDSTIVKCPFSLAVTKASAKEALSQLLTSPAVESWNERQSIASYLCLHHILDEESSTPLRHHAYVNTLPSVDQLRTGLFLSEEERQMFKGTNLYGAILEREQEWHTQWSQCQQVISHTNERWGLAFTQELFFASASHISSRAFPSTLLSENPTLQSSPATEPILLPGIDSLNHARGQPVSWAVSRGGESSTSELCVSLVIHNPTPSGNELFNNYGAKPNSELVLGYGFSISNNPDDTILLKIGGGRSDTKWEVGRSATGGAEGLWDEIMALVTQNPESEPSYEDELDGSSMLGEMVNALIEKLPPAKRDFDPGQIRPDVVEMFQNYIEGQRDILDSLVAFANAKERAAVERARREGVEIVLED